MAIVKKFLVVVFLILVVIIFSCKNVSTPLDTNSSGSQDDWVGQTVKKNYSASDYMFEVTNTTRNLDITLPDGKYDIYAVQINNSDYTVKATDNQYIVDVGFLRSVRSANGEAGEFVMASKLDEIDFPSAEIPEENGRVNRVHFVDNFVPPPFYENSSTENLPILRSSSYFEPIRPNYVAPNVGETKNIYVDVKGTDNPDDISKYDKKTATLEAVGQHCYVWVVNSYLGDGFKQIDKTAAEKLKNAFDDFYEYVRYVFGEESDELIARDTRIPMLDKKVNIVVYDIMEDATEEQTGGILGYFASKDYYSYIDISNEGKYFYIDSYFAKKYWNETISTLAHEFQHMISFNVKNLQQGVSGYTGYNEMLSMLCEDMLQTRLRISDLDSPKGRFLNFVGSYYKYGIFDNPDDADFYSVAYMFGAFLARNYGGAKLVSDMAKNGYGNAESITAALRVLGHNKTFGDVLKEYAKALVLPNNQATFNKDAETYENFKYGNDNYKFPMTGFNIFNFDKQGTIYSMLNVVRRDLIKNKSSRKNLHGKGIIPYYVGYADHGGEVRLMFSSPVNSNSKVYVLVSKR